MFLSILYSVYTIQRLNNITSLRNIENDKPQLLHIPDILTIYLIGTDTI